jgi:hypothetical protein
MDSDLLDRASDRLLWEQIKTENDLVKAVHMMADLGYGMVVSRKRQDEELACEIKSLQKVILGNGDPTNSIVAKLDAHSKESKSQSEALQRLTKDVNEVKLLLIGDVTKGPKNESLLDMVQHATKTSQAATRVVWLIVGVIVAELVMKLLGLF